MVVDAASIDQLFTKAMDTSMLALSDSFDDDILPPPLLLLAPSMLAYQDSLSSIMVDTYSDDQYLRSVPLLDQTADAQLLAQISSLSSLGDQGTQIDRPQPMSYVHMNEIRDRETGMATPMETSIVASKERFYNREMQDNLLKLYKEQRRSTCGS